MVTIDFYNSVYTYMCTSVYYGGFSYMLNSILDMIGTGRRSNVLKETNFEKNYIRVRCTKKQMDGIKNFISVSNIQHFKNDI